MKKISNRQYVVLGLGIFGSTVAKTLSSYNCEVIALDNDENAWTAWRISSHRV